MAKRKRSELKWLGTNQLKTIAAIGLTDFVYIYECPKCSNRVYSVKALKFKCMNADDCYQD